MANLDRIAAVVALALVLASVATDIAGREMEPRRNSGFHVTGAGGADCGTMTSNLRTERQAWSAFYSSYTHGFISGANFVSYLADHRRRLRAAGSAVEFFVR